MHRWPRRYRPGAVLTLVLILLLLLPSWAAAYTVPGEVPRRETVTRGVTCTTYVEETGAGTVRIHVLQVDLTDPYLRLEVLFGADNRTFAGTLTVREMARRAGAVAALNGDFFHLKEGKHPLGMVVRQGELVASPMERPDHYTLAFTSDGRPVIDVFAFSGEVVAPGGAAFPLAGLNKPAYSALAGGQGVPSDVERLHLYTPAWGPLSRGAPPELSGVVEMVVAGGTVREIRADLPGVPIPQDGYVLRAHGRAAAFLLENFRPGDPVTLRYAVQPLDGEIFHALGGQALLVDNGRRVPEFSQNIPGRAARSAAGISADGKTLYLVAVEQGAASRGMTQEELADFLVARLGVWRALNLDGGGSTSLVARPLGEFDPVLVNVPAKGAERRVPNCLAVFSDAPPGNLAGIVVKGPAEVLAGVKYGYAARGYDEYFNPCRLPDAAVAWTVEEGKGRVENGILTAEAGGTVVLAARCGDVTGRLAVRVLGYEDLAALEVTPARISVTPGGMVQLTVRVRAKDGRIFPLRPEDVTWDVDVRTGTVRNGAFIAADEAAAGHLTARFNGLEARVPVEVVPEGEKFVWAGAGGAVIEEGGLTVKIGPQAFSGPTPVRVAPLNAPADLPPGWQYVAGLRALPAAPAAPGATCSVQARLPEGVSAPAAFFLRTPDGWVRQPSWAEEGVVRGRLNGLGDIALAVAAEEAAEPPDLSGHWAREAVLALARQGMVRGFPDGTFRPDARVTRAEFAVLLAGALGWAAPEDATLPFRDRIPDWAAAGVAAATARGVLAGYPDGYFRPAKPITRAEMAVLVDRALSPGPGKAPAFADAAAIPRWAAPAVERVAAAGLMRGAGGSFRPLAPTTRGETAALVLNMLRYWTHQDAGQK